MRSSTDEPDPVVTYLQDLERKAKRLHEIWRRTKAEADGDAWSKADLNLRWERFNCTAVECPQCEGTGEIVVGWDQGGYWVPPEPVYATCPTCARSLERGYVLPEEAERYKENEE